MAIRFNTPHYASPRWSNAQFMQVQQLKSPGLKDGIKIVSVRHQSSISNMLLWLSHLLESKQYVRVNEGLRINRVDIADNETFWCRADVLETGESRDYPITVIISSEIDDRWWWWRWTRHFPAFRICHSASYYLCHALCHRKENGDLGLWINRFATAQILVVLRIGKFQ